MTHRLLSMSSLGKEAKKATKKDMSSRELTRIRNVNRSNKGHNELIFHNVVSRTISAVIMTLHNLLPPQLVSNKFPPKPYSDYAAIVSSIPARVASLSETELRAFKSVRGTLVKEIFGTQEITIRIRSDAVTDGYTAGIVDTPVLNIDYQQLHDQGSWAALFDEYIIRRGHAHWFSYLDAFSADNRGMAIGAIDYDDSATVSSIANLMAYDTHKVYSPCTSFNIVHSWPFVCQGPPDISWTTTATNLVVAYFKFYCFNNTATIGTAYTMWYDAEVSFRQIVV